MSPVFRTHIPMGAWRDQSGLFGSLYMGIVSTLEAPRVVGLLARSRGLTCLGTATRLLLAWSVGGTKGLAGLRRVL